MTEQNSILQTLEYPPPVTNGTVTTWQHIVHEAESSPPGLHALQQLRDGKYAVLVIKGLLSQHGLAAMTHRLAQRRAHATVTNYVNGTLTTIGPYLARHLQSAETYFADAAATDALFPNPSDDLRLKLRHRLRQFFGLKSFNVLREHDGRSYAPAIVRLHADGISNPLHNDNIRRDAHGTQLRVAELQTQFSCICCIQECTSGGALLHYGKRWHPDDERFKIKGGLGYDPAVVEGYPHIRFKPQTGDVYIINPTFYHSIERVEGEERITLGFFFGSFDEEMTEVVAWS